jgi:hypothetical protein
VGFADALAILEQFLLFRLMGNNPVLLGSDELFTGGIGQPVREGYADFSVMTDAEPQATVAAPFVERNSTDFRYGNLFRCHGGDRLMYVDIATTQVNTAGGRIRDEVNKAGLDEIRIRGALAADGNETEFTQSLKHCA